VDFVVGFAYKCTISNFTEIRPAEAALIHTDGHMTKLSGAFRDLREHDKKPAVPTRTFTCEIWGSNGDDNEDCSLPGYEYRVIWWLRTMVSVEHAASRITPPA
jgi:hypothetical protein